MAWIKRTFQCFDCGKTVTRNVKSGTRYQWVCYDCGEQRAIRAAHAMRDKAGPDYERWKATNGNPAVRGRERCNNGEPPQPERRGVEVGTEHRCGD